MAKVPPFLKKLYNICLAHPWLMQPMRDLRILPSSVYQHLFVKGKLKVKAYDGVDFTVYSDGHYVETLLFWGGVAEGWEKESLNIWFKLAKRAKFIVDVGANTGVYSLVAGAANQDASIFAFEPIARVYNRLQRNVGLNSFHIKAYQLACGSSVGEAVIYDSPVDNNYEASMVKNPHSRDADFFETTINITTLDHMIASGTLPGVDLMKIDVEKYEAEVLAGFSRLGAFLPDMLIEILDEDVARKVELQLQGLPYLYFNIDETRGPERVEHLKPSATYNFLICKEESAAYLGLL